MCGLPQSRDGKQLADAPVAAVNLVARRRIHSRAAG